MHRDRVSSTVVESIGYDDESAVLEVEFASGAVYQYFDVPEQVYRDLMSAASMGKAMTSSIIGKFRFAKV